LYFCANSNGMMRKVGLSVLVAALVYACATVPVTGRKQMNLISNAEIIQMSAQQYDQVLRESKLSNNQEQVNMIKRVGTRIQSAVERYMTERGLTAQLEGFNWQFNLIEDDKTVNAWCMPGGKVAFYTAILPVCKDETGVAVVMGHEVAHAIANHGRERMSQQMAAQFGLNAVSVLMGQNPTAGQELLMQAVGAGTSFGMLKFSRDHESEADHMGLIFMAMARYDPSQAPAFWERMSSLGGGQQPPEFMSTHPSHETRISDLKSWMPEALQYYKN
jgi:predicted Zn-dependent protease